jgi:hypothetical protein
MNVVGKFKPKPYGCDNKPCVFLAIEADALDVSSVGQLLRITSQGADITNGARKRSQGGGGPSQLR